MCARLRVMDLIASIEEERRVTTWRTKSTTWTVTRLYVFRVTTCSTKSDEISSVERDLAVRQEMLADQAQDALCRVRLVVSI